MISIITQSEFDNLDTIELETWIHTVNQQHTLFLRLYAVYETVDIIVAYVCNLSDCTYRSDQETIINETAEFHTIPAGTGTLDKCLVYMKSKKLAYTLLHETN
tara:strand:+ start:822 stop:1130 length:309 start_codon:yes stop_codon:yes gene_type:complete